MLLHVDEEITFRKLEILLAFMEAGNLTRAAEKLDISAVSVHRALHSLETGLRCALFRHEGRNLHPTEAAHALAEVARDVLRTMSEGVRATREVAGYSADRIRIGSLYSLTSRTVPQLIMGMKLRKPDLHTELVLGSNAHLLQKLRRWCDRRRAHGHSGRRFRRRVGTAVRRRYPVCRPGRLPLLRAGRDRPYLSSCAGERFVSLSEGFVTYRGFVETFRIAGFTPNVVMKTDDIFSLMNLVSGGVGYTLLPGRVRGVMPQKVQLIPLQPRYLMRQTIALDFLRTRERDPNLLALLSVCRLARAELG